jgi:hypothetical protein
VSNETVRVIRDILPGVSERTLRELRSLLAYSLAAPSSAELREQRLGLLVQMIARAPARIPLGEEYESERSDRAACGEEWPSRIQLGRAYGSWLHAVSAAMELDHPRSHTATPSYQARPMPGRPHTRRDAIRAITRCRDEIGKWPTQSDYLQWRRIVRHTGRLYGPSEPRLPDAKTLRRLYGNWTRARDAAQRWTNHELPPANHVIHQQTGN